MSKNKKYKIGLGGVVAVTAIAGGILALQHNAAAPLPAAALTSARTAGEHTAAPKPKPAAPVSAGKTAPAPPTSTVPPARAIAASTTPAVPAGLGLYVNPNSSLAGQAAAWSASHPADAAILTKLTGQPIAEWFGGWNANVQTAANSYVSAAAAAGKLPVLVAYNIPNRDCGGESAGGAASASEYQNWINAFAAGIGNRRAIVILEPDALAAGCYTSARAASLAAAVNTLAATTKASVYLDAGNANWMPAATIAARLQASGLGQATGFSLNISNFQTTAANTAYGTQVSQLTGGKHFVIDTSRNGNGPTADNQWCNPAGRAVGNLPTLSTGQSVVDAYLWVKALGESDGQCGPDQAGTSAPSAGTWWPQYTLSTLQASGW